jgi:hypothetical protein
VCSCVVVVCTPIMLCDNLSFLCLLCSRQHCVCDHNVEWNGTGVGAGFGAGDYCVRHTLCAHVICC